MLAKIKYYLGLLTVIALTILAVRLVDGSPFGGTETEHNTLNDSREDLALCLKQKDVLMYGIDTCQYCLEQKSMFGKSFDLIKYVNCDFESDLCQNNGIKNFPSWKINGQTYTGVRSLAEIAKISNCPFNF